jgi:hypothetical protein
MRWFTASPIVSTLLLTLGLTPSAHAGAAMFQASFILHAFGNDVTMGSTFPSNTYTFYALPLGATTMGSLRFYSYGGSISETYATFVNAAGTGLNNGDLPKIRRYAERVIERSRQLSEHAILTKRADTR